MAFCTNCGQPLQEGSRFCAHCGAPVSPSQPSPAPPAPPTPPVQPPVRPPRQAGQTPSPVPGYPPYPQPKRPRKGLLIGIAAGSVLAAVLVLALVVSLLTRRTVEPIAPQVSLAEESSAPERDSQPTPPPAQETVYAQYTNSTVLFSLEYPEDYSLSEPNANNVLITDQEGLRIAVEYAFTSQSQSYLYSGADFAAQIDRDPQVLADWVGAGGLELTGSQQRQVAGTEAYVYSFRTGPEAGSSLGELYIFDGHGELGCYALTTFYPEDSRSAALYEEQCAHVAESLRITGSYMPEGYRLLHSQEGDYSFLLHEDVAADVEVDGKEASIYPVEGVYTKCSVNLDESVYDPGDGEPWDVLTRRAMNLLSDKDSHSNGFTRQDFPLGRYEYVGLSAEYTEDGARFLYLDILFQHEEAYWQLSCRFTPEYQDAAYAAVSDVLASLRFGDEAGVSRAGQAGQSGESKESASQPEEGGQSLNRAVAVLLDQLEDEDISRDLAPLISVTDMDGNGTWELLVSYVEKDDGAYEVEFGLWTLEDGQLTEVAEDTLYTQAGGNTGAVGLAKRGDVYYLTLYTSRPQDQTFHRYYRYAPISAENHRLEEGNVLMESHTVYDQGEITSGNYKLDGKTVNQMSFESAQKEFGQLVTLDLMDGPGSGGLAMTWDQARSYDFDGEGSGARVNLG